MKEKIETLQKEVEEKINHIASLKEWDSIKVEYLGKKGPISEILSGMRELSIEEKKETGKLVNALKQHVSELLDAKFRKLDEEAMAKVIENESIDVTLPAPKIPVGTPNILEKMIEEVEELFMSMGYDVVEGPEVEQDYYNFELLNLPKGHPARDAQDTFYTKGEELLLRSQTSPVQIRTMLANEEKEALRIICPGKTYRRDDDDATHSHQFTQMEGLLIDQHISLADLKGTFDIIARKLFGQERETRFRPSFYPFTEPSVELDISCFHCGGEGCPLCKKTGWITVGGAGMVHPRVLENGGYDSKEWTGFAFGFGMERLAMLKYGITDIRTFYTNDLRVTETFNRKEAE